MGTKEDVKVKWGVPYRHLRTGRIYTIKAITSIHDPLTDNWSVWVEYMAAGPEHYRRRQDKFLEAFEEVTDDHPLSALAVIP